MARSGQKGAGGAPAGRKLRVLVVEDNEVNQALAAGLLERCGHDSVVVPTGSAAVAAWERDGFDLILMDLQMPEMDGFEATRAIRRKETGTGARTPIVALTANAASTDEPRCRDAGMDAFMAKPVSFDALCDVIERVVDGRLAEARPAAAGERDVEVFDLARALAAVDGERELLLGMIAIFLRQTPRVMQNIDGALERGDAPALEIAAHKLKGSVAMFGAQAARGAAQRLEDLAGARDLAPAGGARRDLGAEIARLQAALEAVDAEGAR